jgi:hypothetical protein
LELFFVSLLAESPQRGEESVRIRERGTGHGKRGGKRTEGGVTVLKVERCVEKNGI